MDRPLKKTLPVLDLPRLPKGRSGKAASGLTLKQDFFCQYVAAGHNQSQAYRLAFSASNAKPSIIHSKASDLAARGKIQARIDELKQDINRRDEDFNIQSREVWFKRVWAEIDPNDLSTTTPRSRVSALNLIGKALHITTGEPETPQPRQSAEEITQQIMAKLTGIKARQDKAAT